MSQLTNPLCQPGANEPIKQNRHERNTSKSSTTVLRLFHKDKSPDFPFQSRYDLLIPRNTQASSGSENLLKALESFSHSSISLETLKILPSDPWESAIKGRYFLSLKEKTPLNFKQIFKYYLTDWNPSYSSLLDNIWKSV